MAGAALLAAPAGRTSTTEELVRYDGVNGHQCLVAFDGYLIEGFALWSMGRHSPSGGRARCGLDLTAVIDESPTAAASCAC